MARIGRFFGRLARGAIRVAPRLAQTAVALKTGGLGAGLTAGLPLVGQLGARPLSPHPYGSGGWPQPPAVMARDQAVGPPAQRITGEIFHILTRLLDRAGIVLRNPNAVVPVGRRFLARLLRFVRVHPLMNAGAMLISLGLTAVEADRVITWFATEKKRHRRIRVTNVKALNRSIRRLEGFRRLSARVELALARRGIARSRARGRFTRARCRKCGQVQCVC